MENNERLKMARKFVREHGKIGFRTLLAMLGQDVSCGKIGSEFGIDLYTVARYKLHFVSSTQKIHEDIKKLS